MILPSPELWWVSSAEGTAVCHVLNPSYNSSNLGHATTWDMCPPNPKPLNMHAHCKPLPFATWHVTTITRIEVIISIRISLMIFLPEIMELFIPVRVIVQHMKHFQSF
jgi:hypothetical protein